MALLTCYTAANRIVLSGKTRRITCGAPSAPIVSATKTSRSLRARELKRRTSRRGPGIAASRSLRARELKLLVLST